MPGTTCTSGMCCSSTKYLAFSPRADSENLDFAAPLEEHLFYGIFCFFGSPSFILKTFILSKSVGKTP